MYTAFAFLKQPTEGYPPIPPPPPPPPPSPVTWKYRYIANADGTTRLKTASNLYFTFNDTTYTRTDLSYTNTISNTATITTDNNTATEQFIIYRDLCRGTGGSGSPRIDEYIIRIYQNGTQIFQDITGLANPLIPTCPTQDSRSGGVSNITVSAGDEIIIEWTDNLTV